MRRGEEDDAEEESAQAAALAEIASLRSRVEELEEELELERMKFVLKLSYCNLKTVIYSE